MISPSFKTIILSQYLSVETLWLIMIFVEFDSFLKTFLNIKSSVFVSTADKLSSKIKIEGSFIIALAIAIRCF